MTAVVTFDAAGADVGPWFAAHREPVLAALTTAVAVRVTGLAATGPAELSAARDGLHLPVAPPGDSFAERTPLGEGVLTAPDWPGDRELCLHHEGGYRRRPPRVLLLAAATVPTTGGATLLAGTAAVRAALPAGLVDRFTTHGWLATRTFRPYLGLPWTRAFGLDDPAELARWCAEEGVSLDQRGDGTVHTRQTRPAVIRHPLTGEMCWANQVAFLNQASVPEPERGVLLATFPATELPFNTFCGDGSPVTAGEHDAILAAYDAATVRVALAPGEVLLWDNLRTAHGREPYTGERSAVLATADPVEVGSVGGAGVAQLQP